MFEKDYQRIKINYPRQTNAIEQYMEKLATYEAEKQTNIDLVAGLTGEMLGEIFAWKQDEWYDELKTLGFYLGKFIYLMDAYEDRDKDEKKDSYNPLRYLDTEDEQEYETLCRLMMTSMISECAKSFERLPKTFSRQYIGEDQNTGNRTGGVSRCHHSQQNFRKHASATCHS